MSPGYWDWGAWKCRECGGVDPGMVGKIIHRPTCSTQEGYREARMREAVDRAERRARRQALLSSAEAKQLRALRTVKP